MISPRLIPVTSPPIRSQAVRPLDRTGDGVDRQIAHGDDGRGHPAGEPGEQLADAQGRGGGQHACRRGGSPGRAPILRHGFRLLGNGLHPFDRRARAIPIRGRPGKPSRWVDHVGPTMTAMPAATPISASESDLARITYDERGLVPAIVQEQGTGRVLMMAWMNAATLARTLAEGRTVFWSRSRQEEWAKGDTSGDRQWVREAYYDCDGDTLLFVVEQEGKGACHTGEVSCFYRPFGDPAQ